MLKRVILVVLIVSIASVQSGCSMVVPGKQRFSVTASESDAKIYVNGDYAGKGNVQTRVPRNRDVSVLVKKEGYLPVSKSIGTDFSITGILDIVGGCIILIPWLGLLFPGARSLEQTNVAVVLEKDDGK
ncbi:MAG: PEGA domain-containing protein [Candidatus Omnitrophota bacterium]